MALPVTVVPATEAAVDGPAVVRPSVAALDAVIPVALAKAVASVGARRAVVPVEAPGPVAVCASRTLAAPESVRSVEPRRALLAVKALVT